MDDDLRRKRECVVRLSPHGNCGRHFVYRLLIHIRCAKLAMSLFPFPLFVYELIAFHFPVAIDTRAFQAHFFSMIHLLNTTFDMIVLIFDLPIPSDLDFSTELILYLKFFSFDN